MPKGTIVVGIDGSEEANVALEFALQEAEKRDCDVDVVSAIDVAYGYWDAGLLVPTDKMEEHQRELVEASINKVSANHPDVHITPHVVEDRASHALIDRSKDAEMLVVGTRGKGGFSGLLLGSVSQQVVHHAQCPVVVVPSNKD